MPPVGNWVEQGRPRVEEPADGVWWMQDKVGVGLGDENGKSERGGVRKHP